MTISINDLRQRIIEREKQRKQKQADIVAGIFYVAIMFSIVVTFSVMSL